MNQIMLRHAEDDFTALLIANGLSKAGAEVFSITNNAHARPKGFEFAQLEDHLRPQKFIVWARVRDDAHIAECDKAVEKCLNEQKP